MENRIRGAVFNRFPSISSFAKAIGWSRNKAFRIINMIQEPDVKEIEAMVKCIGVEDANTLVSIFFPDVFTK